MGANGSQNAERYFAEGEMEVIKMYYDCTTTVSISHTEFTSFEFVNPLNAIFVP